MADIPNCSRVNEEICAVITIAMWRYNGQLVHGDLHYTRLPPSVISMTQLILA